MPQLLKSSLRDINFIEIGDRLVPIMAKHNPRARRIIVRVDLAAGIVQVTSPSRRSLSQALLFAQEQREWIAERLDKIPPPVPFKNGAHIPFRGREHIIRHIGSRRAALEGCPGPVWRVRASETGGLPEIHVTGHPSFLQRRVTDWLKAQARAELNDRALAYAEEFDVRPSRISLRDQTSRWGSCSPSRALSFSWRLILAPAHVLDYVAAHEVAHLRHMNHGKRFWALVASTLPNYDVSRQWLETHGPGLHRYGISHFGDES